MWAEVRPGSEVLDCLQYLESQALREVNELRAWRRSGAELEPGDLIMNAFWRGTDFFRTKSDVLGIDRLTRLQWRGMPEQWWSTSRIAAETRDDAVRAWLQISENAANEISRIENSRSFFVSIGSAFVALVALVVAGLTLVVECFK